jgi:hypothetical protein
MDLSTEKPSTDSHEIRSALHRAGNIIQLIDKPRHIWNCDSALLKDAREGAIGLPRLLAAYATEAVATEVRMTEFQKKEQNRYQAQWGKNFLPYMLKPQRETLKRALHDEVQPLIASAHRLAAEAKYFDGMPLMSSSSGSTTIDDTRADILALKTEAHEQIKALQLRIAALDKADERLSHIETAVYYAKTTEVMFAPPAPAMEEEKRAQKRAKH